MIVVEQVSFSSPDKMRQHARDFAARLRPGDWIGLSGPLGAGKTTWTQGLAQGLGVADEVVSPSYTLVNVYHGQSTVCHVDLYRVRDEQEITDLGLDHIGVDNAVVVIEWVDNLPNARFPLTWLIAFARPDKNERSITVKHITDHTQPGSMS
jgi:tRNA threonylcarbamoyladenosine biosynthesis protein TsaE